MKKRLFAIMLALAMLLAAVPALAEEGEGGKDQTVESIKKVCTKCNVEVDKVNEEGLCEKCVSNLKQDNTQQKMITSFKTLNEDDTEGGTNGGSTGSSGDNTDESSNTGNNGENTGNTSGEAGDNNGESSNTDSTGNSDSTDGNTGTNGGQNPLTNGGGEGGEQPANPPQSPCNHTKVGYEQYDKVTDGRYTHHKKVCKDCGKELVKEPHQWDEATKKPKTEGTNIPTCTNGGDWTVQCRLCGHVTVLDGLALGHDYGDPTWNWCGVSSATATFKCTRCGESQTIPATVTTRNEYSNCYVYTRYTATVEFNGNTYTNTRTDYSCRPDWYYDPCYYNNPCGHWGCGNVCTRYSDCVPCRDYRTTFRVGGYNCLATPKTGDVSVMAPAMLALIGAAGAMLGKKRR